MCDSCFAFLCPFVCKLWAKVILYFLNATFTNTFLFFCLKLFSWRQKSAVGSRSSPEFSGSVLVVEMPVYGVLFFRAEFQCFLHIFQRTIFVSFFQL